MDAIKEDFEQWRSKLVCDPRMHFHRCLTETELKRCGPKAANQVSKLSGLLKDPPMKYSLRNPVMSRNIPPLGVVVYPSVDTSARNEGKSLSPAVPGEMDNNDVGFNPGPYEGYSWALENNQVPTVDYEHKKYACLKGHDFK